MEDLVMLFGNDTAHAAPVPGGRPLPRSAGDMRDWSAKDWQSLFSGYIEPMSTELGVSRWEMFADIMSGALAGAVGA